MERTGVRASQQRLLKIVTMFVDIEGMREVSSCRDSLNASTYMSECLCVYVLVRCLPSVWASSSSDASSTVDIIMLISSRHSVDTRDCIVLISVTAAAHCAMSVSSATTLSAVPPSAAGLGVDARLATGGVAPGVSVYAKVNSLEIKTTIRMIHAHVSPSLRN